MKKEYVSLVFTGDIGFDRYMSGKYNDPLFFSEEIIDFCKSADYVVANVEGALYRDTEGKNDALFFHAMDPDAVVGLRRIFANVWSIGNNHIMDAGIEGLLSTKNIAALEGARTVGAGLDERDASEPIYIDEAGGIGIICVGYNDECVPATADGAGCFRWDDMALIKERISEIKSRCRHCVVIAHGGEEFSPLPLPYTRERYIQYLEMGADVVVGHHPHVVENFELFDNNKAIFYSLGNFVFDTDYQRAHKYTDVGLLLRLTFSESGFYHEALGIKNLREENRLKTCELPPVFTNIDEHEYSLLAPLAAKAFIEEDKRKMIFMEPSKYSLTDCSAWHEYFSGCSHVDYVEGSHMDFGIIVGLSNEAEKGFWKKSKLEDVKEYIQKLI